MRPVGVAPRLALFAAGLVVVFVAAFGVGHAVGPDDPAPSSVPPVVVTTSTTMASGMEMGS